MSGAALLAVLAVTVSAIAQIFTDPRITRNFLLKSLVAIAIYAAHCVIGVLVVFFLLPHGPDAAGAVVAGILGWIGLGVLGLIRFSPRLREPPKLLLHFGAADLICLLLIGFAIASAFGALR